MGCCASTNNEIKPAEIIFNSDNETKSKKNGVVKETSKEKAFLNNFNEFNSKDKQENNDNIINNNNARNVKVPSGDILY